ncbi:PfkB family carbohydrate kinase [Geminicoccus roseus]|uniref:PfkB family carbohydrate kinase n=1 Tax=Geminicoccus roseus TaxID=404900 RepID=UPI00041DA2D4|nr:PfkB family carbohydrate kinase [Geminicoccus roseus]
MSATTRPVICLGAAVVDLVFQLDAIPREPTKILARSKTLRNGGPAGTGAVACSRLGIPAAFWGNVGDDEHGAQTREALRRHGVDVSGLNTLDDAATVLAIVMVDPTGERLIVAHGADIFERPAGRLPLEKLGSAGAVLADTAWVDGTLAILEAAREAGVPSVFDGEDNRDTGLLLRLASLSRYPVFCEGAFAQVTGSAVPDAASLQGLASRLGRDIGVTLGERGSLWWIGGTLLHVPALQVDCKDTTGAGDVFHGAFAGGIAEGMPVERAIRFASAAAALKCAAGNGWDGMPDRETVERAMVRIG